MASSGSSSDPSPGSASDPDSSRYSTLASVPSWGLGSFISLAAPFSRSSGPSKLYPPPTLTSSSTPDPLADSSLAPSEASPPPASSSTPDPSSASSLAPSEAPHPAAPSIVISGPTSEPTAQPSSVPSSSPPAPPAPSISISNPTPEPAPGPSSTPYWPAYLNADLLAAPAPPPTRANAHLFDALEPDTSQQLLLTSVRILCNDAAKLALTRPGRSEQYLAIATELVNSFFASEGDEISEPHEEADRIFAATRKEMEATRTKWEREEEARRDEVEARREREEDEYWSGELKRYFAELDRKEEEEKRAVMDKEREKREKEEERRMRLVEGMGG